MCCLFLLHQPTLLFFNQADTVNPSIVCVCSCACICLTCAYSGRVQDRMHVHMCFCVGFISKFALSGVTSVPYASPGLTQYAHTDEDQPSPKLLESYRCKCHVLSLSLCVSLFHSRAHTHIYTPNPFLHLYYTLFYIHGLLFSYFPLISSSQSLVFVCMFKCITCL